MPKYPHGHDRCRRDGECPPASASETDCGRHDGSHGLLPRRQKSRMATAGTITIAIAKAASNSWPRIMHRSAGYCRSRVLLLSRAGEIWWASRRARRSGPGLRWKRVGYPRSSHRYDARGARMGYSRLAGLGAAGPTARAGRHSRMSRACSYCSTHSCALNRCTRRPSSMCGRHPKPGSAFRM